MVSIFMVVFTPVLVDGDVVMKRVVGGQEERIGKV
jgi:hypothetical protein